MNRRRAEDPLPSTRRAANPKYELYHARGRRTRMPIFWWLQEFSYTKFFARELTSLAVGYAAVVLIVQVWALSRSEEAYQRFLEVSRSTPALILHTVVLLFLLFHSLTWLNLAPRALVVRLGRRRVPDTVVLAGHYVAWLAATALVVWYLVVR